MHSIDLSMETRRHTDGSNLRHYKASKNNFTCNVNDWHFGLPNTGRTLKGVRTKRYVYGGRH
jgi:hypothetical protein